MSKIKIGERGCGMSVNLAKQAIENNAVFVVYNKQSGENAIREAYNLFFPLDEEKLDIEVISHYDFFKSEGRIFNRPLVIDGYDMFIEKMIEEKCLNVLSAGFTVEANNILKKI